MPLFPTVPNAQALGPAVVRYTRPAAPLIFPDLSYDFLADLPAQVGNIRTDTVLTYHEGERVRLERALRLRRRAEASVAQKCIATLAVQRGWHRAFRRAYGIDYERAMQRGSFGRMQADLETQITDQLTRITGVASVSGFVWRQNAERAYVRVLVRLTSGVRFSLVAPVPPQGPTLPPPEPEYPGGEVQGPPGPPGPPGPLGPPGPAGTRGTMWFVGSGDPSDPIPGSIAGDLYLNKDNGDIWQVTATGFIRL